MGAVVNVTEDDAAPQVRDWSSTPVGAMSRSAAPFLGV